MTDAPSMNPVSVVLSFILDGNTGLAVFDYSNPHDFRRLWSFEGLPVRKTIILWSDTAPDPDLAPINAADCLSPIDWAVVNAARHPSDTTSEVLILDLNPDRHRNVPSLSYFQSLRSDQLPWLRVTSDSSLASILQLIAPPAASGTPESNKAALTRFKREIRLNLTDVRTAGSYDRHAISNIVAPMILRGKAANETLHSTALLRLLQACELVALAHPVAGEVETSQDNQSGMDDFTAQDGDGLHLFLVDDQAKHGWEDWVRDCFPKATLSVESDPTHLVKHIAEQLDKSGAKDLRFSLNLPGLDAVKQPIVLLDLRLFSGKPRAELAFYRDTLLPQVNRFADRDDLAWPSFSSSDPKSKFVVARNAINAGSLNPESPEHPEALTWLPRVMALIDMSLPIVLFSSTDRKGVVAPLLAYKNIYTAFQKPPLPALSDPSVRTTTVAKFREAIAAAVEFGRMRKKCQTIQAMAQRVEYARRSNHNCSKLYVELYVDETLVPKAPDFSVGGLFGVFQNLKDADEFDDACVSKGLRYFKDKLFQPNVENPLSKERDDGVTQLSEALENFRASGKHVALGFVRLRRGKIHRNHVLADDSEDGRLHKLVCALVELFCAESLPAIAEQYQMPIENISSSVYLATRSIRCAEQGDFTYRGNVDIRSFDGKSRLRSMGGRDAWPIVRNALAYHPPLSQLSVERAIAVCLPYEEGKKNRFDRVIHRPSRTVYDFDLKRDIEIVLQPPLHAAHGIVCKRVQSRYSTGQYERIYVSVTGLGSNVCCFYRECRPSVFDLPERTVVMLNVEETERGLLGKEVVKASEEALESWILSQSPVVSRQFLRDHGLADFRPDYRALHYSADQALSAQNIPEFGSVLPSSLKEGLAGQFDEDLDEGVDVSILSSRSLDAGLLFDALTSFCESSSARDLLRPSPRAYLARRLWETLLDCKGDAYCGAFPMRASPVSTPRSSQQSYHKPLDAPRHPAHHRASFERSNRPHREATSDAELQLLQTKWKSKRFPNKAAYLASGEAWHKKQGFDVRQSLKGAVLVFARLEHVRGEDLSGFIAPIAKTMFQNGEPCLRRCVIQE